MRILANVLIYQLIWFACVLGGTPGALASLPLLALHLVLSRVRRADLQLMALLLAAGLLIDGALQFFGFFSFRTGGQPIPLWLAVVWLGLAILPHHSLSWLKGRPLLAFAFGASGGPLAYWAGVRLEAASFSWPLATSILVLALIWGLFWPLAMAAASRILPPAAR